MWQLLNFITRAPLQHLLDWSTVQWCIKNEIVATFLCCFCCPRWAEISPVKHHLPVGHQTGLYIIFPINCSCIPGRAVSLYGLTWKRNKISTFRWLCFTMTSICLPQQARQKLFLLTEIIKYWFLVPLKLLYPWPLIHKSYCSSARTQLELSFS